MFDAHRLAFSLTVVVASSLTACCKAAFIVTVVQSGPNVVMTGRGTIDTAGLTLSSYQSTSSGFILPALAAVEMGPTMPVDTERWLGLTSFVGYFGLSAETVASYGSGDTVGEAGDILTPYGYVSGTQLYDSDTYNNTTFASLGIIPGIYTWNWGTGDDADAFTLTISPTAVPEPVSLGLLVYAAFTLSGRMKKQGHY